MDSPSSSEFEEDSCDLPVISDLNLSNDHYYCLISERRGIQDIPETQDPHLEINNGLDTPISDQNTDSDSNSNKDSNPKSNLDTNDDDDAQDIAINVDQNDQENYDHNLLLLKRINDYRLVSPKVGKIGLQHTLPAYDLWRTLYPTHLNSEKLLNFHRPKLRHFNNGPQASFKRKHCKEFPIKNLSRVIWFKEAEMRIRIKLACQRGMKGEDIINKYLRIYTAKQLSSKYGQLHLFEYCEQYPPLLSQVGMCSTIKTYLFDPNMKEQLYFNKPRERMKVEMIENNLYRAPIYEHQMKSCDFLIIRTRNSFYIRPVNGLYTVGQTMPLTEVPSPTASNIMRFRTGLSNFYIQRIFKETTGHKLPHLKWSALSKLFPDYNDQTLKQRMKSRGAEYITQLGVFVKGNSQYGDLHLKSLWSLLTPEKYCAFMSMLVGRERLRDLNYTETMIDPPKGSPLEIEVLAAPWNTTQAWLNCLKGKHFIDLKEHKIDPTGPKNEGFSCIIWEKSPLSHEYANDNSALNQDHLANLQNRNKILLQIKNQQENRRSVYLEEARLIANVQAKALRSKEVLSSDDESDSEIDDLGDSQVDESFERDLNDLSKLVFDGRSNEQLAFEKEEEIRLEMLKEFCTIKKTDVSRAKNGIGTESRLDNKVNSTTQHLNFLNDNVNSTTQSNNNNINNYVGGDNPTQSLNDSPSNTEPIRSTIDGKVLIITRRYDIDDKCIERTELVRDPRVIALYVKERFSNNEPTSPALETQITTTTRTIDLISSHTTIGGDVTLSNQSMVNQNTNQKRKSASTRILSRSLTGSLGPTELCRAEGTILRISKKVLINTRRSRR